MSSEPGITQSEKTSSKQTKTKWKRSRFGCTNCKYLKIKCSEDKPACQHCLHTKKMCIYLPPRRRKIATTAIISTRTPAKKTAIPVSLLDIYLATPSSSFQHFSQHYQQDFHHYQQDFHQINQTYSLINLHATTGLDLSLGFQGFNSFELRLLRHFNTFGGNLFSFGKEQRVRDFWEQEIPLMCRDSELVRNAVFALSSVHLWTCFHLNEIPNIYIEGDKLIRQADVSLENPALHLVTNSYFQNCLTQLNLLSSDLNSPVYDPDVSGQILATHVILFTFVSIHPISPVSVIAFNDGSNGFKVDIWEICINFQLAVFARYPSIVNTKYEVLVFPNELIVVPPTNDINNHNSSSIFGFVEHLKTYVDQKFDPFDVKHLTYYNCINAIELGCYKCTKMKHVLEIFRAILTIVKTDTNLNFVQSIRAKDYTAMKIVFYYSSICSMAGFKLFKQHSIWDHYIEDFKKMVFEKFNGKFEDDYDERVYETVLLFRKENIRFDLEMLKSLGKVDSKTFADAYKVEVDGAVVGYAPQFNQAEIIE